MAIAKRLLPPPPVERRWCAAQCASECPCVCASAAWASITRAPLDAAAIDRFVAHEDAGAISVFVGVTRAHDKADSCPRRRRRRVLKLQYEAYTTLALRQLSVICEQVQRQFDVCRVAIAHRLGDVAVGEASVRIAVSSEHRQAALDATHFTIDELKTRVAIWKKEVYAAEEGRGADYDAEELVEHRDTSAAESRTQSETATPPHSATVPMSATAAHSQTLSPSATASQSPSAVWKVNEEFANLVVACERDTQLEYAAAASCDEHSRADRR